MDANNLQYDEISYELWIRNVILNATLLEKRIILKQLLQQEQDLYLSVGKPKKFNFAIELAMCQKKLTEIDAEIQNFNCTNMHNKFIEIISRLCHLENRLRVLTSGDKNSDNHLKILKQLFLISVEMVNNVYESEKLTLMNVDHVLVAGCSRTSDMNSALVDLSTSTQTVPAVYPNEHLDNIQKEKSSPANIASLFCATHNPTDISQNVSNQENILSPVWNISYNGTTNDITEFLHVIETLRLMHNFTKEKVFETASFFFKDDALLWYKPRQHTFHNLDYLTSELSRSFQTTYDDNRLWKHIFNRFQREDEKVVFFIASMENLLQRLTKIPSELQRVNIIKSNFLTPIKIALTYQEISTLDQLLKIGRIVEKNHWVYNRYRF